MQANHCKLVTARQIRPEALYSLSGRGYTSANSALGLDGPQFFFSHEQPEFCRSGAAIRSATEDDMVEKVQPITREGMLKIEDELRYLESTRRSQVAEKIRQAKELASTQN